jgi:hypothetical protein
MERNLNRSRIELAAKAIWPLLALNFFMADKPKPSRSRLAAAQ